MHSGGNWNERKIGVVPVVPRLKVLMILFLGASVEMERKGKNKRLMTLVG
jgi:hypothetical protein